MKKLIVLFAIALLVSCAKDGKDGIMGPQGDPGESAKITIYQFPVDESLLTLTPEGYLAFYDKDIEGINAFSIVNVYEKTENGFWRPLPYTEGIDSADSGNVDVVITHTFSIYDGGIRIEHLTSLSFGYKFWRSGNYRVVVFE